MGTSVLLLAGCFFSPQGSVDATGPAGSSTADSDAASSGTVPLPTTGMVDPTADPTTGGTGDENTDTGAAGVCGDAIVDPGEECDNGTLNNGKNGSICKADCTKNVCGDGYVASDEGCDDGNQVDDDACSNACKLGGCGDGVVEPGEECDVGEENGKGKCSALCKLPACGDGEVNGGEMCDQGAANADNAGCTTKCMNAICGDGLLHDGVELCDDGNAMGGDGCTPKCTKECGDGVVGTGEECDDGNLAEDDVCGNNCKRLAYYVFVTSTVYPASLGGVAGADQKCESAAQGLPGDSKYAAWISSDLESAAIRLSHSKLPYIRIDKQVVAQDWDVLAAKNLQNPINVDETGAPIGLGVPGCRSKEGLVWTGTSPGGQATMSNCGGWTMNQGMGTVGSVNAASSAWTEVCAANCGQKARLYCFEQP